MSPVLCRWRVLKLAFCAAFLPLVAACSLDSVPGTGAVARVSPPSTEAGDAFVPPLGYAEEGPASSAGVNASIGHYAALYEVPESLVRRIIVRESGYNPRARNGAFWGLMQIRYDTARSMGYAGSPSGLLDADVNLRYGVKYLAGAYRVARGNPDRAVAYYASGYYYDARRMGLLDELGLKHAKH
jgi:soluble lytic murein transglycosylase-like protein